MEIFRSGYQSLAIWLVAKMELPIDRGTWGIARMKNPVKISSHVGVCI